MEFNKDVKFFIKNNVGDFTGIKRLSGDASSREYFRIFTGKENYLLCIDGSPDNNNIEDNPQFIIYNLFKKNNINIPKIISIGNDLNILIIQDLGDLLLFEYNKKAQNIETVKIYKEIIDILINIHKIKGDGSAPFNLSFDTEKLMYEFNFFIDHTLLNHFNLKISNNDLNNLKIEFLKISRLLDRKEFFVLNHRDFHSRNIIIENGVPFIIDFQDARMGLPLYDLVSLLRDSYVQLGNEIMEELKIYYYDYAKNNKIHKMSMDEFNFYFDIMAFQRNIKAAGSFGYLIASQNKSLYEDYFEPTFNYLADYAERRHELRNAWKLLENILLFSGQNT